MNKLKLLLLLLLFACASSELDNNDAARTNASDEDYMKWIEKMSSFKQKLITQKGNNKFKPCKTIKVSKRSRLVNFRSVQKAIDSIPLVNNCRVVIHIGKGTYREKVEIPATMAYITLEGAGAKKTRIVWDDTADKTGQNGQPLHTYGSATFAVNSPYFIAKNITFKNKAPLPPSGALGKQAVALRVSADMATFINCRIVGAQDTLYDFNGRHYFKNCYVRGSVDFIFGNGLSLYENCHLHGVTNTYGALTAQKRNSLLEETGFSFVNCKVTGSGAFYLGRAWGTFSRVVFAYTYMGEIIASRGWYNWGDKNREMTVFYGQYKCSGPGAEYRGRVPWSRELTDQEAAPFISTSFIDGQKWLPSSR